MQSRNFRLQKVGNIDWLEKNFQLQKISFSLDELIILNASRDSKSTHEFAAVVNRLSDNVFIPIAAGGGISTLKDAEILFNNGADKIVLNSILYTDTDLVKELVKKYGAQSIVASIDYKKANNSIEVYISDGTAKISLSLPEYVMHVQDLNVGEIYLNSIEQDGTGFGYDFDTIDALKNHINVPIIIAGGAGNAQHLLEGLSINEVSAVATANLFNFIADSMPNARRQILKSGLNIASWES